MIAGVRLLVVDDDEVDRMSVVRSLRRLGVELFVTEAVTAREALDHLRTEAFDCVLSDLHMPGDNGAWLLRQVRAQFDVPVIMLTGQGDEQTAVDLMQAGAASYLPKAGLSAERLSQALYHALRIHRAEREARRARERLVLALDAAAMGTWDLDLHTNELLRDARCQAIYGWPDARLSFEQGFASIHPDDRAEAQRAMEAALDPASDGKIHSDHRVHPSLGDRWIRAIGQVFFANGRPVRLVGTVQDITLARAQEAETQRRLEFEQQLLGIVSHDLRNPVAAMIMGGRLLQERVETDPISASIASRVVSSGERANRLLRDLLDFTQARLGGGISLSRQPMDAHLVCRQVVDELRMSHPARKLLHDEQGDGSGLWDPDRIGQMVGNLLRNALTYSPPDSQITLRSLAEPAHLVLEVHNLNRTGPIPEPVQATLFEPFRRGERGHDAERSIGLGLFIVSQIARAHGGSVFVRSTEAEGTVFRVILPP